MKLILTESQYKTILNEYYNPEKLYSRQQIVSQLKNAPSYMKKYIDMLPSLECTDPQGEPHTCTRIPQVVYQYLFGNF
jgi:hypothetical protein